MRILEVEDGKLETFISETPDKSFSGAVPTEVTEKQETRSSEGKQETRSSEEKQAYKDRKTKGIKELEKKQGEFKFEDLEANDTIKGTIRFSNDELITQDFKILTVYPKQRKFTVKATKLINGHVYIKNIRFNRLQENCILIKNDKKTKEYFKKNTPSVTTVLKQKNPDLDNTAIDIIGRVEAGIKNIWMVGPAGCGKSTIAQIVASKLNIPFFLMSCGMGTSAAEFIGYKYPERERTRFSKFYKLPAVIVLDEFTALDPAVAQIANASLANGMIEITTADEDTGNQLVKRHENCIIIATSNTYGTGASLQYNANNQLDASTRDRFVGGVIDVDYSKEYEAQYDSEVVAFVEEVRKIILKSKLQRVASTRMIQSGSLLKRKGYKDWKQILTADWTVYELKQLTI